MRTRSFESAAWCAITCALGAGCGIGSIVINTPANGGFTDASGHVNARVTIGGGGNCGSTFQATLDGVDVTARFSSSSTSPQAQLNVNPGEHLLKVRAQAGGACNTVTDRATFSYAGAGTIYVTDGSAGSTSNDRIASFADMSGAGWTTFGSSGAGNNQLSFPRALFVQGVSGVEQIFAVDPGNHRIVLVKGMTGVAFTAFGTNGFGPNQFAEPFGLSVNAALQIHVSDATRNRVVRFDDLTGAGWTELGATGNGVHQFSQPAGIRVVPGGKIFVADSGNHRIVRMDSMTGAGWTTFGTQGSGPGQFLEPAWLDLDASGRIYVTDSDNCRIARFDDMTGANFVTFGAQGSGSGQFQCQSGQMGGIFVDSAGRILLADTGNARVVRFDDMAGSGWVALGTFGSGVHQFAAPTSVFVKPPALVVAP